MSRVCYSARGTPCLSTVRVKQTPIASLLTPADGTSGRRSRGRDLFNASLTQNRRIQNSLASRRERFTAATFHVFVVAADSPTPRGPVRSGPHTCSPTDSSRLLRGSSYYLASDFLSEVLPAGAAYTSSRYSERFIVFNNCSVDIGLAYWKWRRWLPSASRGLWPNTFSLTTYYVNCSLILRECNLW